MFAGELGEDGGLFESVGWDFDLLVVFVEDVGSVGVIVGVVLGGCHGVNNVLHSLLEDLFPLGFSL